MLSFSLDYYYQTSCNHRPNVMDFFMKNHDSLSDAVIDTINQVLRTMPVYDENNAASVAFYNKVGLYLGGASLSMRPTTIINTDLDLTELNNLMRHTFCKYIHIYLKTDLGNINV